MRYIECTLFTLMVLAPAAVFYYLVLPEIQGLWWDLIEGLGL